MGGWDDNGTFRDEVLTDHAITWRLDPDKLSERSEVMKILAQAKKESPVDYALFAIFANTGLRSCEVIHLRVEGLNSGKLSVIRRKKKELKKSALPIHKDIEAILKRRGLKTGWVFPGDSGPCYRNRQKKGKVYDRERLCEGGHISTREIRRRWDHYSEKLGIKRKGRGVHSLRHYAGFTFYQATHDLRKTQDFLDHASPNVTQVYAHIVDLEETVKKIRPVL